MTNRQFIFDYKSVLYRTDIRVLILAIVFIALLSSTAWSLENTYIRNPVSPSYYPMSQISPSLHQSPDRFDTSGNDLIVGDVRGGTYFRGPVPYRSSTSFREAVPSAGLSSFMRYSAGEEDFGRGAGKYRRTRPYHNPSQTATFTRPGQRGVFTPRSVSAAENASISAVTEFAQSAQPTGRVYTGSIGSIANLRTRPMSRSLEEMERLISTEIGESTDIGVLRNRYISQEQESELAGEERAKTDYRYIGDYASALEEIQRSIEQLKEKASNLVVEPIDKDDSLRPSVKGELSREILRRIETQAPKKKVSDQGHYAEESTALSDAREFASRDGKEQELHDAYKQVSRRVEDLQEVLKQLKATGDIGETSSAAKGGWRAEKTGGAEKTSGLLGSRYSNINPQLRSSLRSTGSLVSGIGQSPQLRSGQADELYGEDISAKAKFILGEYKDLESFSQSKFNEYIGVAESYLKQGRYYRAVSAYTLASIYKPNDSLTLVGKSHALFAAGEYVSSSLFLTRALEMSDEHARSKANLEELFGGRDVIDSRIADIEERLVRSDAPEMEFLLGYIYYQTGELRKAKEAIDTASRKMPDSQAVEAVKKAIYDAMGL